MQIVSHRHSGPTRRMTIQQSPGVRRSVYNPPQSRVPCDGFGSSSQNTCMSWSIFTHNDCALSRRLSARPQLWLAPVTIAERYMFIFSNWVTAFSYSALRTLRSVRLSETICIRLLDSCALLLLRPDISEPTDTQTVAHCKTTCKICMWLQINYLHSHDLDTAVVCAALMMRATSPTAEFFKCRMKPNVRDLFSDRSSPNVHCFCAAEISCARNSHLCTDAA